MPAISRSTSTGAVMCRLTPPPNHTRRIACVQRLEYSRSQKIDAHSFGSASPISERNRGMRLPQKVPRRDGGGWGGGGRTCWKLSRHRADYVIAKRRLYGAPSTAFRQVRKRSAGLSFTFSISPTSRPSEAAIRPKPAMIWIRDADQPLRRLADLSALRHWRRARPAHRVDNTFASLVQRRGARHRIVITRRPVLNGHSPLSAWRGSQRPPASPNACASCTTRSCGIQARSTASWRCGSQTLALPHGTHCATRSRLRCFLRRTPRTARLIYPALGTLAAARARKETVPAFGGMVAVDAQSDLPPPSAFSSACSSSPCRRSSARRSLIEHPPHHGPQRPRSRRPSVARSGNRILMVRLSIVHWRPDET